MRQILLKVGQNTGILLLVNITGALIGFLMAAALGRGLGDTGFGQYNLVMSWLLSLLLFTEFGLSTVLTRDVATRLPQTHRYLVNSLAAKVLLSMPGALLILVFAPYLATNQDPQVAAALRWGLIFFYSGLVYSSFTAVFKAHQVMTPILWLTLPGQAALFLGTLLLLLRQQPLFTIIAWHGLSQSFQCLLAFIFYRRLTPARPGGLDRAFIKRLIVKAWPFALAGFLAALQLRANVLLLAYLQGDQALGWYAAANRFVETGKQLPGAFYAAMLPALAALMADAGGRERLQKTVRRARLGLLAYGLAGAAGALLLAQPILTLTYGAAFGPATATLQILTLGLIPALQNSLFIVYLYAQGQERLVNRLMGLGIALNLGLCYWLIPIWGAAGVAAALLVADSVLYWLYRYRVTHSLP